MKYLVRNNKIEFCGNIKDIIEYILVTYEDNYYIQEYGNKLFKDYNKLKDTLQSLSLILTSKKPKTGKKINEIKKRY